MRSLTLAAALLLPDGDYIVASKGGFRGGGLPRPSLHHVDGGSGVRPTLSPDGRWLVYGTRHDFHTGLRIRDLESGDERWLAYPVQPGVGGGNGDPGPRGDSPRNTNTGGR